MTLSAPRLGPSIGLRAAALLLAAGLGLAGCSSTGSESSSEGESASDTAGSTASRPSGGSLSRNQASDSLAMVEGAAPAPLVDQSVETPASTTPEIIQTGSLTVQSPDVARARFDLDKVLDAHEGTIADEKTTASTEGETEGDVRLSRLELRVPSGDFDATMADLAKLGEVTESTRKAEDVTGEVVDLQARVRAQQESLERVEVLFAQAQDIREIVAIEAQLTRRQADLDSLTGRLAYLRDQTTLSTITVYLEQAPEDEKVTPVATEDHTAFVGGLRGGWHALAELGGALATVAGALLPFALVALVLGVPGSVVVRRRLARSGLVLGRQKPLA